MSPSAHPRLIFGGSTIGDAYTTPEEVSDLLQKLKSLGIQEIDTAARYPAVNFGASERLLGEVGAATAQGFAVDTKILVLSADGNGSLEPAKIQDSVSKSCEALQIRGGAKLNVLYCHAADFETPLEDQASTLDALHKKGIFDKVRASNRSAAKVATITNKFHTLARRFQLARGHIDSLHCYLRPRRLRQAHCLSRSI